MGGLTGSSTGAELAAAMIAMSAHGPIHLASDSQAFVKRVLELTKQLRNGVDKPNRWKLTSDGDLWEHFYNALKAKGAHSFWVTWVKGHATEEHVAKGITTQAHREGNDQADQSADLGAKFMAKTNSRLLRCIIGGMMIITKSCPRSLLISLRRTS